MHLQFKQAVCLKSADKKNSKDFKRGVHHLSPEDLESFASDETFLKYKKLGLIEEVSKPSTSEDVQKFVLEKALAPKVLAPAEEAAAEEIEAPVESNSAEPMDDEAIEEAVEKVKAKASSKKKKR